VLLAAKGRGVHGCQNEAGTWTRRERGNETRATGCETGQREDGEERRLLATIELDCGIVVEDDHEGRNRTCSIEIQMRHDTWRGESGNISEINLAGSAFYGNPGCHGASIRKYNKEDEKGKTGSPGGGVKESAHACKGVEGVMHDQRNGVSWSACQGCGMGLVWVLWVEGI
jgi:hypothetical protein